MHRDYAPACVRARTADVINVAVATFICAIPGSRVDAPHGHPFALRPATCDGVARGHAGHTELCVPSAHVERLWKKRKKKKKKKERKTNLRMNELIFRALTPFPSPPSPPLSLSLG